MVHDDYPTGLLASPNGDPATLHFFMHSTTLKKLRNLKDNRTTHESQQRDIGPAEGRRPAEVEYSIPCSPSRPSPRTVFDRTRVPRWCPRHHDYESLIRCHKALQRIWILIYFIYELIVCILLLCLFCNCVFAWRRPFGVEMLQWLFWLKFCAFEVCFKMYS